MGTERENLELEAARVRLERERLALAREQRAAERPAKMAGAARELARGGLAAAEVARGPVLSVLFYFLRVIAWLLLWVVLAAGVAIHAGNWPSFQSYGYQARVGYLVGASAPLAIPLAFVYAFVRVRQPSVPAALAIVTAIAVAVYHFTVGFPQPEVPLPLGPVTSVTPQSKPAGTGRYFSSECRLMDESPAATAAYREQVRLIERDYPVLNPDGGRFRQDLEALVVQQMDANERAGYSRCVAARLAADAVMAGR